MIRREASKRGGGERETAMKRELKRRGEFDEDKKIQEKRAHNYRVRNDNDVRVKYTYTISPSCILYHHSVSICAACATTYRAEGYN